MSSQNTTILLVEDFSELREFFRRMLAKEGLGVIAVPNGYEGLEQFSRHQEDIQVVITDLNLPGMDGFEVLEKIRHITSEIPVIALSAYTDHASFNENGYMEQFNAVLSKPVDISELYSTITKVLSTTTITRME